MAISAFCPPSVIERAVPMSRLPSHAVANSVVPAIAFSSEAGSEARRSQPTERSRPDHLRGRRAGGP